MPVADPIFSIETHCYHAAFICMPLRQVFAGSGDAQHEDGPPRLHPHSALHESLLQDGDDMVDELVDEGVPSRVHVQAAGLDRTGGACIWCCTSSIGSCRWAWRPPGTHLSVDSVQLEEHFHMVTATARWQWKPALCRQRGRVVGGRGVYSAGGGGLRHRDLGRVPAGGRQVRCASASRLSSATRLLYYRHISLLSSASWLAGGCECAGTWSQQWCICLNC